MMSTAWMVPPNGSNRTPSAIRHDDGTVQWLKGLFIPLAVVMNSSRVVYMAGPPHGGRIQST